MPPDCYKVEVLYLLNPHLIWVEVRDPAIVFAEHEIKFEQIGIYGMLPQETTIEVGDEEVTVNRCKEWKLAAATLMREFLADEEDVWFSPFHLDRRSSIFDDNVHKFGDLYVQKKNGKTRSVSKLLRNSGFATYDVCIFHHHLSLGNINTKLSNVEALHVLTELEKYFINKNVPKDKWESHIKSQTSVIRVSYELEEAFTTTNLDKHNKNMKAILENKNRDLDLCKGVDEPSVGRGTSRKGKEKKKQSPVEKKLEIMRTKKTKHEARDSGTNENRNNEHAQAFEDAKLFLEANASPNSMKIYSKTDLHKAQILKKVMSKTAKKVTKQEKLVNKLLKESKDKTTITDVDIKKPVNQTEDSVPSSCQASASTSSQGSEFEHILTEVKNVDQNQIKKENSVLDVEQLVKTEKNATSASNILPELVVSMNDAIVHTSTISINESNNKSNAGPSTKTKNGSVSSMKDDEIDSNESNTNSQPNQNLQHRRVPKGKSIRKVVKVDDNPTPLESAEPSTPVKDGVRNRSASPLQKLAYPPQNANRDQESQNSRRVPELPTDCEAFATKPVSEHMVKKLMNTFKLTGSKHSEMIQNAIRKCKDGGKNNSEAIAALLECRSKIIDEIKELDDPKNLTNINLDLPLTQTFSKSKLKRRGKKHNVNNGKGKMAFGPPGIDLNTLTRVPPVVLYGDENSRTDGQTAEIQSNRVNADNGDEDATVNNGTSKDAVQSYSYVNKLLTENVGVQEKETKNKRLENRHDKDTSSSSSSMWEKRLKLHKEMAKNKRCAPQTSDTTNKDSSNLEEKTPPKNLVKQTKEDESDESISEIVEKLAIGYSSNIPSVDKGDQKSESTCHHLTVKANPFQNFDRDLSVFVDKLITPIMMVHSKMNKRFIPTCNYKDIHFTDHIRLALRNLRVERPMMMQSITWNAILRGYSVFMIGSPASGKTMGYLPAICRLVTDYHQSEFNCDSVGPFCIIVCATSLSVSDIEKSAKMLVGCDEKVISCYYGYNELAIATSLLNGCDLLITTPPYLCRLLQMNNFSIDLQRLATFVIDDCERLCDVYSEELLFSLQKVREMLKSRVNKELAVQYVVASRSWSDFLEPFAMKSPDTVVCIGAFQECILYAKAHIKVSYVKKGNKLNLLLEFFADIDPSKRTVVVCDSDEEVMYLSGAIQDSKYFIFASSSNMTVQDLYNLSMLWRDFREPLMAPVLVCRDANLYHMNIVNAHYLVQYSMPSTYSEFCRRFATLNENYSSIFRKEKQIVKILILLEENHDLYHFPKIIHFVKRCTSKVPDFLETMCLTASSKKDTWKAENLTPLCNSLMSLGLCPELLNCKSRHTILKKYDKPKKWMPKSGIITFKILHFHSAVLYSARLTGNIVRGKNLKYPSSYSNLSLKMGMHYSNQKNRILFGIPKIGDICAVALTSNLFSRCQIIKIVDTYERGNPKQVLVNLLDEEIIEIALDINLYHLPDELKDFETYVVHVRLTNIQPRDKDIVFSELARDHLKRAIDLKQDVYMRGNIALTVGNCIFVNTLEACQDLKSVNETIVLYNVRRQLLENHAEVNPNHLPSIVKLCELGELETKPTEYEENEFVTLGTNNLKIKWADLGEDMVMIDVGVVESPDTLFVRLTKFEMYLKKLLEDIQKYVAENDAEIEEFKIDDVVLAEYPDDCVYERARIDEIGDKKIKCFFVDQGEWRYVSKDKFLPISDELIDQLPFQSIECRLVGIKPPGDQWTDFSTNWLYDKCAETESGAMKHLFLKCFTKTPAQYTGGYKYGIVLIDTYGNEDQILNQLMIDLNLAKEVEDEIKFLGLVKCKNEGEATYNDAEGIEPWKKTSKYSMSSDTTVNQASNILLSRPIRSFPLVATDDESDDSEKWNINMTGDMVEMFKPLVKNSTENTKLNMHAIEGDCTEVEEAIDIDSLSKHMKNCSTQFDRVKVNSESSKELDSDDLSSSETGHSANETSEKSAELLPLEEYSLRKPKLIWRQTKTNVTIKIQLIGAEQYNLKIQDRELSFTATVMNTNFGFEFELYGVIDKKTAIHSNKGQYILVKFNKIMHKNWLTLTKDGGVRKWIAYDVDSIDTSSDEEETQNDSLYHIVRCINKNSDSDSDDRGTTVDDINYQYKNND